MRRPSASELRTNKMAGARPSGARRRMGPRQLVPRLLDGYMNVLFEPAMDPMNAKSGSSCTPEGDGEPIDQVRSGVAPQRAALLQQ